MFLGAATGILTTTGAPMPRLAYTVSSIVLCLVLFAAAMRDDLFLVVLRHRTYRWIGPVLTTLGTICGFVVFVPGLHSDMMAVLCGILTGVGSAFIDLGWGEVYRNVEAQQTGLEIPFATFLAAVIYALGTVISVAVVFFFAMLMPLASGFIYLHVLHVGEPGHHTTVKPVSMSLTKFTWRIGTCACLVGIADGVMRQVCIHINAIPLGHFYHPGMVVGTAIMAFIIMGHQLFARDVNFRSLYKFVVFMMALFFMLVPVFTGMDTLESIISLASYNSFNVLIWILLASLCYTYRLSTLKVFGIGWGMVTLGACIGQIVANWLVESVTFTPPLVSLTVLVCTLAVLGSDLFLLREDDIIDITKVDDTTEEVAAHAVGASASADDVLEIASRTPFKDRCREVAEGFGLTPRETEILILFAKGRSSARIQEDLVLSRGTVTTHLQHIYQKTGVHSKQELLDLIERR